MPPRRTLDILIPSYNRPKRLFTLLKTGMELAIPGACFVVIDDGSTVSEAIDGVGSLSTKQVCDYFNSPQIIYLPNRQNIGLARSWEKYYAAHAEAKYTMSVVDKDIFLDRQPIVNALQKLEADDALGMVVIPMMQEDRTQQVSTIGFNYPRMSGKEFISRFIHDPALQHCASYGLKRTAFIKKAGVPRNMQLADKGLEDAFGIDIDLVLLLAAEGDVEFETAPHIKRLTLEGATERWPLTFAYTYYQYAKRALHDLRSRGMVSKADMQRYISMWLLLILRGLVVSCQPVHGTELEQGTKRIYKHLTTPIHIYLVTEMLKYGVLTTEEMRGLYTLSLKLLKDKRIIELYRADYPKDMERFSELASRLVSNAAGQ